MTKRRLFTDKRAWSDYLSASSVQPPLIPADALPATSSKPRKNSGFAKKPTILERDIQKLILDALRIHPLVARIERINVMAGRLVGKNGKASRFIRSCKAGRVDLDGFTTDGRVIAIEVKRPQKRNNLTIGQTDYLNAVRAAGGLAGVATCVEEALAIVEQQGEMRPFWPAVEKAVAIEEGRP